MIVVAVPARDFTTAKQRLQPVLDPTQRAALARAMLRDVLAALATAPVDQVWVVSGDADVTALAREFGATPLAEPARRGHTAAVALAQRQAVSAGVPVFVTVPGDVPCVTAEEIGHLVDAARDAPAAVFTPSRSGIGTNGVALAPPDAMPLRFGEPSFDDHLAAARRHGLAPRVLMLAGLGLDVDRPADLRALLRQGALTESGRLVARWGIAARLAALATAD